MEGREPPWSRNQLRKLGDRIRDGGDAPLAGPTYLEVTDWYRRLAEHVAFRVDAVDWMSLLGDRPVSISWRPKTVDTLRQKLQRDRRTPLPSIQDVAGVRLEADMTLDEQDQVVAAIVGMFDHGADAIRDLRVRPHSGYRAVHVWLRLPPGRAEVQVRTLRQGDWANMYETAADVLGRGIRYGGEPPAGAGSIIDRLQQLSATIADVESARNRLGATSLSGESARHIVIADQAIADAVGAARTIFEAWRADKAKEVE